MRSEKLATHFRVDRYGDFTLTDAVRPGLGLPVVPREGFRLETYRDPDGDLEIPALVAAVSRDKLFEVYLAFLDVLGDPVDLVLETSHHTDGVSHRDLHRQDIEMAVLLSHLCEFEDLLLNDGCTGAAVVARRKLMEVQLDEHKLLIAYAHDLEPFERILFQNNVLRDDELRVITEGEHFHSTEDRHLESFEQLCCAVGILESFEHVNG